MRPNLKLILGIVTAAVCVAVVAAGMVFFSQQDHAYRLLVDQVNQDSGRVTLNSHHFGPLIDKYKSPYMGAASNMSGLFNSLLLVRAGLDIEIDSNTYTVQVYYKTPEDELGSGNVRTALAYNSVAAFTLIDNLEHIRYYFPGNGFAYQIDRKSVQAWFNAKDLADYFPNEILWQERFQEPLKDTEYMNSFFSNNIVERYFDDSDFDAVSANEQNKATAGTVTDDGE